MWLRQCVVSISSNFSPFIRSLNVIKFILFRLQSVLSLPSVLSFQFIKCTKRLPKDKSGKNKIIIWLFFW